MGKPDMKARLDTTELYLPDDSDIMVVQFRCLDKLREFNALLPSKTREREAMMKEMFAEIGEGCYIESPAHSNWGFAHCHWGSYIYANFNLTMVDDTHIYVGDHVMFGPNVTLATAGHPVEPGLRAQGYQYNAPVHIGTNCWLGAGVIVLPGVTIGDNTVIAAGSVVTHDIPANVVAGGIPCRILREIGERDHTYYFRDHKINWDEMGEPPHIASYHLPKEP